MSACRGGLPARSARILATVAAASGFLPGLRVLSAQQPVYALFGEALLPSPIRWPAGVGPARYASTGKRSADKRTIRAAERVFCGRLRSPTIAANRVPILLAQKNTDGLCHARESHGSTPNVDPMFVSLH